MPAIEAGVESCTSTILRRIYCNLQPAEYCVIAVNLVGNGSRGVARVLRCWPGLMESAFLSFRGSASVWQTPEAWSTPGLSLASGSFLGHACSRHP